MRTGFFTYAWDLMGDDAGEIIDSMANTYHCGAIMLSAFYHHARLLYPRAEGPKTRRYDGALAAFTIRQEFYSTSGIMPSVEPELAQKNVLENAGPMIRRTGMDYGLWVVGLHNSTLGEAHPDLCVSNCFGDVYTYTLCPGQSRNRAYLFGLIGDVCSRFTPDRILLEAAGPLGLKHGLHHELFMTDWDSSLELLFSLCFCPTCQNDANDRGIDAAKLQAEVVRLGNLLLDEERGGLPLSFREHEPVSLLFEVKGLYEYLRMGMDQVSSLVGEARKIAGEQGVLLEVIPASFHRPVSSAWLERGSLRSLASACDGLLISAYFADPDQVEADLNWAAHLAPGTRIAAGINACSPTPDASVLLAQARACQRAGCDRLYYYNYGLLTRRRLDWVRRTNEVLADKGK